MTRLKNTSGEVLYIGRDRRRVEDGEVIDVEGAIDKDSPEDGYVTGEGDDARAWPKSQWSAVGGKSKSEGDES